MRRVYIAGPLLSSVPSGRTLEEKRAIAISVAILALRRGDTPICMHTITRGMEQSIPEWRFMEMSLELLRVCQLVILLPEWEHSRAALEKAEADKLGIPIVTMNQYLFSQITEDMSEAMQSIPEVPAQFFCHISNLRTAYYSEGPVGDLARAAIQYIVGCG